MFPMIMTISNATQLNAVLAALNPELAAQVKVEAPKDKATTAKKQEVAATTQPTAEAVVADAQSDKAEDSAPTGDAQTVDKPQTKTIEAAAPSYEATKKAVLELSSKHGRTALENLLKDFGAAKLPDVKPEQYAAVVAAANKLMGV